MALQIVLVPAANEFSTYLTPVSVPPQRTISSQGAYVAEKSTVGFL